VTSAWKDNLDDEKPTENQIKASKITQEDVVAVLESMAEEMGDAGLLMSVAIPPETYLRG